MLTIKAPNVSLSGTTSQENPLILKCKSYHPQCWWYDCNWGKIPQERFDRTIEYNRVKSKRNDEKNENELFTFAEGNEWTDFLSISGSPIFSSVVHSLCFSETSIHSATHSINI